MPFFSDIRPLDMPRFQWAVALAVLIAAIMPHVVHASSELAGKWRATDGSAIIDIAPCSAAADLCATVIEETLKPGEPSSLGKVVIKDIRKDAKKGWQGKFVDGKTTYDANINIKDNGQADFRVCVMLTLCDTLSFARMP